jgi:hypothetical protein
MKENFIIDLLLNSLIVFTPFTIEISFFGVCFLRISAITVVVLRSL